MQPTGGSRHVNDQQNGSEQLFCTQTIIVRGPYLKKKLKTNKTDGTGSSAR